MGKTPFVESSKQAAKGGFRGIKKVRGLVVDIDRVPPPEGWETTKEQIQVRLEEAVVLEMFEGEEEFELRDGKFSFLYPYAEGDAHPSANGPYMRCLVASAEKLGKKPTDFIGQVVTFAKMPTKLFSTRPNKDAKGNVIEKGEDGKFPLFDVITEDFFSIVADEGADNENTRTYAREAMMGLGKKAALRKLLTDTRLKQLPGLKDKLADGTLAAYLELQVIDGKFAEAIT